MNKLYYTENSNPAGKVHGRLMTMDLISYPVMKLSRVRVWILRCDANLLQASVTFGVLENLGQRIGRNAAFSARDEALNRHGECGWMSKV